jgi:hypothetical protein
MISRWAIDLLIEEVKNTINNIFRKQQFKGKLFGITKGKITRHLLIICMQICILISFKEEIFNTYF